jgi:hypothetical protein
VRRAITPEERQAGEQAAETLAQVIHTHSAMCRCPLCLAWLDLCGLCSPTREVEMER